MNMHSQMSGQISGQVSNQAGSLPGLTQQNGHSMPSQMQHSGAYFNAANVRPELIKPELIKLRRFICQKIFQYLIQRQQAPDQKKLADLAKRIEEALFRNASGKCSNFLEEYSSVGTLESRILALLRRSPTDSRHQQFPNVNSSTSSGAMIPTPGMPQSGNSSLMVTSAVDSSMISANSYNTNTSADVISGSFFQSGNGSSWMLDGSSNTSNGPLTNGYQQSSSTFTISSSGNNMMTSLAANQMIPTPGLNNMNNYTEVGNSKNRPYMNSGLSKNVSAFSVAESNVVSQPVQQKQLNDGQSSLITHNFGSNTGGDISSYMQKNSYGFPNGELNDGTGIMGSNTQLMTRASGSFPSPKLPDNTPKPLQECFDQHQQPHMQGERYGTRVTARSGSGNFFTPVNSVGSVMDNQSLNAVNIQLMPKRNSPSLAYGPKLHTSQPMGDVKLQSVQQSDNTNMLMQDSLRQKSFEFHQQKLNQPQHQQNQYDQKNQLLMSDLYGRSLPSQELGTHGRFEPNMKQDDALHDQTPEQLQFLDAQNLFQQSNTGSSLAQTSEQMQALLYADQYGGHLSSFPHGFQSDGPMYSKAQDGFQMSGSFSHEQNVEEFGDQKINISLEGSQVCGSKSTQPQIIGSSLSTSGNPNCQDDYQKQVKFLLLLRHARRCSAPEGKCYRYCISAQALLKHVKECIGCASERCRTTKKLINHNQTCGNKMCPVCIPVSNYIQAQSKLVSLPNYSSNFPSSDNSSCQAYDAEETVSGSATWKTSPVVTIEDSQPSLKRIKIEKSSQSLVSETEVPGVGECLVSEDTESSEHLNSRVLGVASAPVDEKMENLAIDGQGNPTSIIVKKETIDGLSVQMSNDDPIRTNIPAGILKQEGVKFEKQMNQDKQENISMPCESTGGSKSGKSQIKGVSLIELFTPEQVREHIRGLRQWIGQSKAKAEKNQAMEHSMSENSCQLCAVEKLTFEPPPIYCSRCGGRIKRNAMYYTGGIGDTRHYFCIPCYNEARGENIFVDRSTLPKARLEKKKNDEETEEWWVQCDKCEAWQHQICSLFNGKRNDGGQAEYTCPNCYVDEIERGEREPLPQTAVLGAKDLPRTILSDHIEQRLFWRLKQERQERAKVQGKSYDEVPGAEGLVVRVVSSVDKKLEVKPKFLEIFQEENYPSEYPYKSKVLLLFQKIEGVEVCLFGMYVQEFGSECQQPNHRRVYISYLDSVKYFRPEIKAVTGDALRTFVYHEILIGYLDYCKKRGFTSCYIWACPPLKGEDYILYCHPEIQKTPKSDKLREWYLSMLRKAAKENIVADLTNFYDHFFVSAGECKAKVTASRLPYFEGDYWPGAAEDILYQLQQEEEGGRPNKKGIIKKAITKRALKASGQTDLSSNGTKDLLLMRKLGETISPMKEDFIMVHLQHACSHCCILMVCGHRWVCSQCKKFQICDKCYEAEQKLDDRERHPINQKDKHALYPVEVNDIPAYTKDDDDILESEFFDTRQAFLSLCQGNHYQYDTLRRAKHSSMMVLYHLHNPTAPAFVTTCNICHNDIESGQNWRCEVCPEYDVCNACYEKDGAIDHPHKLTNHPSVADRDAQNKEARELRVSQFTKMLDLLVHASQCRSARCQYPNCRKVKGLFRHGMQCTKRASGGCPLCKRMWYLLQIHARSCKASECHVPRCRDLKEHMRRLQQQSESRRRAAVMEMMRQRAAEVAGNSG